MLLEEANHPPKRHHTPRLCADVTDTTPRKYCEHVKHQCKARSECMNATITARRVLNEADDPQVLRARSGDAEAFTALACELEELLYLACYRVLRHRQAAEDAKQEALLNAWRRIETAPP